MKRIAGQTAALHIAFWQYDPWYRRAWFVWPQAAAILLASWLLADRGAVPIGKWAKSADCSNASSPGCAATQRTMFAFFDEVAHPTISNQGTVTVDRSAFRSSASADQSKLSAALAAYHRGEFQKALDTLKGAAKSDPNVQFISGLAYSGFSTIDQAREAQSLLRSAADAGQRQAGTMLGRMLFIGWNGSPQDEQQGRKLIEDGAAAGDTYAMRLAAVGYLSRQLGTYDPVKAVDLIKKAADAGEPVAMAQLAYSIRTGRGGLVRDEAKALDYLRRSAEAGYTDGQYTLARWAIERYNNRETEDPSEGVKWYERAYQRGYNIYALVQLANVYRYARATPWFDTRKSFALLQLCAPYSFAYCHYQLAGEYWEGAGTAQDLVKAYAHYTVAQQLGWEDSSSLQKLEGQLLPAARSSGKQLADSISSNLKPMPSAIALQIPEVESVGPSPWAPPSRQPAVPAAPSQQSAATADWTTCKGKDPDPAIAACARLIASGISGTELGVAHFFKAWRHYDKKQYEQSIAEYDKAIQLRADVGWAHNNRGVAYRALGNLEAALRDFDEGIRTDPSNALAYANRADVYNRQNQWDKAIADASNSIRLDPKRDYPYWVRAGAYQGKEQWTEAVSDCTTAIGLNPKYDDCFERRGWSNFKLRKYDLALADLDAALRLEPRWSGALVDRALVHKALGNFEAAFRDYEKAAALGHIGAMTNLGLLYMKGEGVARDYAEAHRWFEKAAQGGDVMAINNLGFLYESGQGVPRDYAEARRWYEKAAQKGNALAMNNLGTLYRNGQGVPKSLAESKRWFEKAAALGHSGAMNWLGVMYHNGEGVPQNYNEAWRWYDKAAALGESWAMYNLGIMYENGQGVARSRSEAVNWYQKAAAQGNPDATRKLQTLR